MFFNIKFVFSSKWTQETLRISNISSRRAAIAGDRSPIICAAFWCCCFRTCEDGKGGVKPFVVGEGCVLLCTHHGFSIGYVCVCVSLSLSFSLSFCVTKPKQFFPFPCLCPDSCGCDYCHPLFVDQFHHFLSGQDDSNTWCRFSSPLSLLRAAEYNQCSQKCKHNLRPNT